MRVEKATSFFLPCPSCGKGMRQTGYSPLCEIVIYDFLCSDDGDRLSWQARRGSRPVPAEMQ
jgi:hypothetical protein